MWDCWCPPNHTLWNLTLDKCVYTGAYAKMLLLTKAAHLICRSRRVACLGFRFMYDKLSSLLSLPSACYSLLEKVIEEEAEKSAVTSARCKTAARDLGKPLPMSQIARFGTQHMYPNCGRHAWITELRGKEEEEWKNISSTNRRERTHTLAYTPSFFLMLAAWKHLDLLAYFQIFSGA